MWEVEFTGECRGWFAGLESDARISVNASIQLLQRFGPALSRPHADTLKGSRFHNMKELRVGARRLAIRIAFAFDPDRKAILLVAGDKRGVNEARFYKRLIARADKLFEEYLKSR